MPNVDCPARILHRWALYEPQRRVHGVFAGALAFWEHLDGGAGMPKGLSRPLECVAGAGETMYLPAHWTHATLNIDDTVAFAQSFAMHDANPHE